MLQLGNIAKQLDISPFYVEFGPTFTELMNNLNRPIEFPYLIDTTEYMPSGNPLTIPGIIMSPKEPVQNIVHHMHYLCGLPKGGNIQVIGGAKGFNLDGMPTMDELIHGLERNADMPDAYNFARDIYRAAYNLEANIITGGTQSGIMALLSSLWLADQIINEDMIKAAAKKSSLLNIPLNRIIETKSPSLIHIVPQSTVAYPGNTELDMKQWPWPLAPSTCVFAVSGKNGWGSEGVALEDSAYVTSFIPLADNAISSLPFNLNKYRQQRVSVIMNGGYLSLIETKSAIEASQPAKILALEGTGRFADLLSASIKNDYAVPKDNHPVWKLPGVLDDYGKANYSIEFDDLLKKLKSYDTAGKALAYTFEAGKEGMTPKIESIMNGHRM